MDCHHFWRKLDGNSPETLINRIGRRSQGHPLTLYIHLPRFCGSEGHHKGDNALERVISEGWPIGTLEYHAQDAAVGSSRSPLPTFLSSPSSSIVTLDLLLDNNVPDLFDGSAPRLEAVTLDQTSLTGKLSALSNLRRLDLRRILKIDLHGLLELLRHSPKLQELVIDYQERYNNRSVIRDDARWFIDTNTDQSELTLIVLSELRSLSIHGMKPSLTQTILGSLFFPLSAYLDIQAAQDTTTVKDFHDLIDLVLRRNPPSDITVDVRDDHSVLLRAEQWTVAENLPGFGSGPNEMTPSDCISLLQDKLPVSVQKSVTSVNLYIYRYDNSLVEALGNLFPALTSLSLKGWPMEPWDLDFLRNHFPKLHKISLVFESCELDELESMVEAIEQRSQNCTVTSLETCSLEGSWRVPTSLQAEELLDRIRAVVPNVDVEDLDVEIGPPWTGARAADTSESDDGTDDEITL